MDRTILHSSLLNICKKANEPEKITEATLCDEIHDNLRTLALIHPFNDEFNEIFQKGMFIKPNTKAFPHCMRYLFLICDPSEFKKKFCWPIYNKAAEATFRNSTLELLNKLNAKYHLGLGEVRNKILIFPGGMEFMRVIYELTRLSMQIILKRNGIHDPENHPGITMAGATKRLEDLEDLCNFVLDFKKKVESLSEQFVVKTAVMNKLLRSLTKKTIISPENILHDKFTASWEEVHSEIVRRGIEPALMRLTQFQQDCARLEGKIQAMFKNQMMRFDENALSMFGADMQRLHPQYYQQMDALTKNGHINLDNMLTALQFALPSMIQSVEMYKPRSVEALSYESIQIQKLSQKADTLLQNVAKLGETADVENDEDQELHVANAFENLQSMILLTPTISHDAVRRGSKMPIKRLSLLEDAYQARNTEPMSSAKKLNSILEDSMRASAQKVFLSPNQKPCKEPRSKLDAMAILKSISKKDKYQKPGAPPLKSRAMYLGAGFGLAANPHDCSKSNDTVLSVPDFSSTLLNQSNDIKDHIVNVDEQINTSLAKSAEISGLVSHDSERKIRPLLAHDTSLDQSPSGLIESLVLSKNNLSDVKPMKLFEKDTKEVIGSFSMGNITLTASTPPLCGVASVFRRGFDRSELNTHLDLKADQHKDNIFSSTRDTELSNIENNQNAPNKFNINSMIDENAESLFNMSDRILFNEIDDSILS